MSNNDIIKRGELKKQVLEYVRTHIVPTVNGVLTLIGDAPAVPHEMTAREFVRALFGLTSEFNDERWDVFCRYQQATTPEEAVAIVEAWAREHPEERSK